MSTQIQCKKKCQHKKSMWNIYLYIYIVYSEYFSTYFSRRWHKFLYPEFEWSQWEVSLPTDPSFYTCFHDAHLSLIVSYQFNLLNYVHYLFVCFLNIFMSKEIHKNESRLRLLQKKKITCQIKRFICDREENCIFIISYCLIFWTVCYLTLDFRPYSKRS